MTSQTMRLIHIEMLQNDTFVMIAEKKICYLKWKLKSQDIPEEMSLLEVTSS